jgi:hypothetical protein
MVLILLTSGPYIRLEDFYVVLYIFFSLLVDSNWLVAKVHQTINLCKLMLRLFERKIFYKKYFLYFSVFGATENDGQRKSFLV